MKPKPKKPNKIIDGQKVQDCNSCKGIGKKNKYVGHSSGNGYQLVNAHGFLGYAQVIGGMMKTKCMVCNGTGKISSYDDQVTKKKG